MEDASAKFKSILYEHLIPEFCGDPRRRCEVANFVHASNRIGERDAHDFVEAWEAGLIEHQGGGLYRSANGSANEQFFWEGPKAAEPRPYTLWIEPVITVAALGRLHRHHGWPKHLIGAQSPDWAFDVVAMMPNAEGEHIAGEVKKSAREVVQLIDLMQHFGKDPGATIPHAGRARNAYKKVASLRARRAPIFWALGPEMFSRTFKVNYRNDGGIELVQVEATVLNFPEVNGA